MKQFSKDLGNVSLAPKGKWSREQEYEKLALVYNTCDNLSYVAKIDVPSGVDIENREYWQPMNATGYADNNFINLTTENENGTITAYETLEEAVATILPINRRAGATLSFYNINADRLDRQAEFELWQFNSTDLANWENRDYWNNIYYNWNVFAGWYVGADALKNHVKIPNVGQYAYVGTNLNNALLYQCRTNGTWTNTGIKVRNYISVVVSGNITIGDNGNWFSDGKDTGIPATPAVDEQLDNIIIQLQQHATEIDELQKQDVVLKSNIDSNFETINNKVDAIKTTTDNKIDSADANLQNQIISNDTDIATLNTKHESLSKTVQGIAATGGASTATNVTYNNDSSGLNAENAQDAIDEVSSMVIYDVSTHNNGAVFESLQALLSSSNLNTLIPTSARRGGMTIRFIQGSKQSSDNKYVQYRLTKNTWSTTVTDWQGVDDTPKVNSNNLVKSGGVAEKLNNVSEIIKYNVNEPDSQITILNDKDEIIAKISKDYSDFKNLKSNDIDLLSAIDEKMNNIEQIQNRFTNDNKSEFIVNNDEETEELLRIGDYGIKAKGYFDINGNPIFKKQLPNASIGAIEFEGFNVNGYSHIICYGQSFSCGNNTWVPITGKLDAIVNDTFMLGNCPTDVSGKLSQLKAAISEEVGYLSYVSTAESPVVSATYAIKAYINKIGLNTKLIASACGTGSMAIKSLKKGTQRYQRFLSVINNCKIAAGNEPISCPIVIWMQGENDQIGSGNIVSSVAEYKSVFLQLKEDMSADIKTVYGQSSSPLFFVYQPGMGWDIQNMFAAQALFELSNEHPDIILMNPDYFLTYGDANHPTSNGQRWYGEHIAKSVYNAFFLNKKNTSVVPREFTVNNLNNSISILCEVPYPPLIIDTKLSNTNISNYGFSVYIDGVSTTIQSVQVCENQITIYLENGFGDYKHIEIEYAGVNTNGFGNIRDSDCYASRSKFYNPNNVYIAGANPSDSYSQSVIDKLISADTAKKDINGNTLFGERYPMYNWLNNFKIQIV